MRSATFMFKSIWILKPCILVLLIIAVLTISAPAFPIPAEIKKTVAFIYTPSEKKVVLPNGTGFFVGILTPQDKDRGLVYLVTAKHVLQKQDKKSFFEFILLRLNTRKGSSQMVQLNLFLEGPKKNVFIHQDATIDLAVIPIHLDIETYDYQVLPSSIMVTKKDYDDLKIGEGTEVFFTGLFLPYTGKERIYPIVRFGRLALVTDEKIVWDGIETELYLMETASYGGNSGSPVFFQVGMEALKPQSLIIAGSPVIKLAGIMKGFFADFQPIRVVNTDPISVAPSNMGIAAVVPVHQLHEILFGDEVRQRRGF